METKYLCSSKMVTTTGSEIVRPDFLPVTSNVTRKSDAAPDEPTAAHALFRILAIQLGRCPRYNHRLKPLRVIYASARSIAPEAALRQTPQASNSRPFPQAGLASQSTHE